MPDYLTLNEFKQHHRIDHTFEDGFATSCLDSAEAFLGNPTDGYLRRPVTAQSFTEYFKGFASIKLKHPDGVSSVSLLADGEPVTANFTVRDGCLKLDSGESWPAVSDEIEATYVAGWAAGKVPEPIKRAGYFIAASLYDHRDSSEVFTENLKQYLRLTLGGYRRAKV